jgi:hypothetical protein
MAVRNLTVSRLTAIAAAAATDFDGAGAAANATSGLSDFGRKTLIYIDLRALGA